MSVEWISMGGISLWSPSESGPWSSNVDNDSAANPTSIHWRLGGDATANQHTGKVVRGFRLRGAISFSGTGPMVLDALRGIAETALPLTIAAQNALALAPVPAGKTNASRYNFDWRVDRTQLPIGFLTPETEWWNAAGMTYGGVRSAQSIGLLQNAAGGGRIMRADPGIVQLLVSERPVAELTVIPQMVVGQVSPASARLYYPGFENDPVAGVEVSLSASPGTQVGINPLGPFAAIVRAVTNAEGYVYFSVKSVSGGTGPLVLDIAGDTPVRDTLRSTVGFVQSDVASQVSRSVDFVRRLFQPALPLRATVSSFAYPDPPGPGQCVTVPAIPAVPGIPSRVQVSDDFGWNAGAHSLTEMEGDFELVFDEMGKGAVGAVIGVMPAVRENQGDYTRVTHGFYFTKTAGGTSQVSIIESGRVVFGPITYPGNATFAVQRLGTVVLYLMDDRPQHTSTRPLVGTAMAGTSLYATSDEVPSTDPVGDCFWTDVAGAAQVCGGGGGGGDVDRTYVGVSDNGVMSITLGEYYVSDGNVGVRFEGAQAKLMVSAAQGYFPSEETDYMVVDLVIERMPRASSDPFGTWAYVGDVSGVTIPKTFQSNNGGDPNRFYGDIDGLPALDPAYVYRLDATCNIYSASDELVDTNNYGGAIFDSAAEDGATANLTIRMEPVEDYPGAMDVKFRGCAIHYAYGDDGATMYTGGWYVSAMSDFTCSNFMASIDGQPVAEIPAMCS